MADFCMNCYKRLGFPEPDICISKLKPDMKPGEYAGPYLCEDCGYVFIGLSYNGRNELVWTPKKVLFWKKGYGKTS